MYFKLPPHDADEDIIDQPGVGNPGHASRSCHTKG